MMQLQSGREGVGGVGFGFNAKERGVLTTK